MAQRFSLSSSQFAEHERVPAWAKLVGDNIFGGHLETIGASPFNAALTISNAGPAICVEAQSTPVLLHRRKADIGPPQAQRFIVQAIVEGHPVYFEEGAGRYAARPGDLIMGVSDNACGFVAEENTRVVNLALPRALVVPRYADMDAIYRRFEERDFVSGPATHLLFDLVAALGRGEGAAWRASSVVDAIGSLVALALDGAAREKLGSEGAAAARLSAIVTYLHAHYADAALNPESVARALEISVRYLNKLMERSGRTFRAQLLDLRLEAAMWALRDPTQAHRAIAELAQSSGFRDLSHFNRRFRARFDVTPRQARKTWIL